MLFVTYLEKFAFRGSQVGHVALIFLLHLFWQFAAELLFFSASSSQLELTNFQPIEFGGLSPVARRAEYEVFVKAWRKENVGVSDLADYVGFVHKWSKETASRGMKNKVA